MEPAGPSGAGLGPAKKNPFTNRAGFGSRVGLGYEKTQPEPDPLPFLTTSYIMAIKLVMTYENYGLNMFSLKIALLFPLTLQLCDLTN